MDKKRDRYDDAAILLFSIFGWMPAICLAFVYIAFEYIAPTGNLWLANLANLIFVYILFAPLLFSCFRRRNG